VGAQTFTVLADEVAGAGRAELWPQLVLGLVPGSGAVLQGPSGWQHRGHWTRIRPFYETSVREPMAALLDELSGEFGPGGRPSLPGRAVPGR